MSRLRGAARDEHKVKYVSGRGACRSRKTPVGSLRHLPGRQGGIFENSWPNERDTDGAPGTYKYGWERRS